MKLNKLEIERQRWDDESSGKKKGLIYATVTVDGEKADITIRLNEEHTKKILAAAKEQLALACFEMAENFRQEFIEAMEDNLK